MELKNIIIGLLLVTAVITGSLVFLSDMFTGYGVADTVSSSLNYDYINSTFQNSQDMKDTIIKTSNSTNPLEIAANLGVISYNGIILSFKSLGNWFIMLSSIGTQLGFIPAWVITIAITILLVTFVFIIAQAIISKQV
jgi:hypothetical protein